MDDKKDVTSIKFEEKHLFVAVKQVLESFISFLQPGSGYQFTLQNCANFGLNFALPLQEIFHDSYDIFAHYPVFH